MSIHKTWVDPRRFLIVLGILLAAPLPNRAAEPGPISARLREEWDVGRFYQKQMDVGGLPVIGSAKVSDAALAEAAWIVGHMLDGREDLLKAMRESRVRVAVMAAEEYTTDLPEHSSLKPKLFWDRRARGLGATPANPVVSCGEENLLAFPGDPYPNENIFVHEFAHAIHGTGLNKTDPTFDQRLKTTFEAAIDRGLWKNTYAATNHSEYWAEGVQSWFDDNAPRDALHNGIRTRARLKEYDPALAKLCQEVFGDGAWRYQRPAKRGPEDRRHLAGYDPDKLPRFGWREVPLGDKPRATIQTALGDFDVELDTRAAPEATALFLKIALDGGYHSGQFHQAVRDTKEPATGSVTAKVNSPWLEQSAKRLKLEDAPASKAPPVGGTIALVRGGEDPGAFVIFVGSPPERPGDVVPFGRVVKGHDVVRKVLAGPLDGDALKAPTDIRRVIRTE